MSRVFDSVVVVSVKRYDTNHNAFHVTGTGVVVMSEEDELLILTAYHLFDNQEYFVDRISVHVYGHDNEILVGGLYKIDRRNDLALIKIASSIPLDAIPISDPASGDLVTMISGSESADRHIGNGFVTKVDHDVVWFAGFDVHAGNSGSPLLNRNGYLVGIVIGEEKVAVRGNTIVGIFEDTWGIFGLTTNWHPNAIIVAPDLAEEGRVVYFDGSQSEDIDGRIVSYRWKFDDESVEIGPAAEKIVSTPGRFGATLTVKDDKDQESITYKEITVIKRIRDIILVTVGGEGNVVIDEGVHGFGAGLIFEHNDFSIDGEFGTTVPNRILGSVEDALEVKREFDGVLLSAQYGYKFGAEGDGGELGAFVAVGRDTAIANTSTPEFHAADIPTDLVIDEETGVPTLVYEPLYIRQEYETEATLFPVLQAHLNYSFRSGLTLLDISGVLTSAAKSSRETHHHYRRIGENGSEEELPQRTVFASLPVLEGMVLAQAGLVFPISETFAIQAVAEGGILTS
ncbi:MAG: PKD domain-containing protein, partial [Spirochaetales bacterium]|nr:PKD domain-containing protein [Spirochaetales bacterium]